MCQLFIERDQQDDFIEVDIFFLCNCKRGQSDQ
jgi:hypothetical protein